MPEKKSTLSAVNTFLILGFGIATTALGWSLKHNVESVERRIDAMAPRREMEIQLAEFRQHETELNVRWVELTARLTQFETETKVRLAQIDVELRKLR